MGKKAEEESSQRRGSGDPCKALRNAYDRCFNRWYLESYVKMERPNRVDADSDCAAEWQRYHACFTDRLNRDRARIAHLVRREYDSLMNHSEEAPPPPDQ